MHGLVNRSIQSFLTVNYGQQAWQDMAREADLPQAGFEAMLHYPDSVTEALLKAATRRLDRSREGLLEDLGAHLAALEPVRRLLRFGGADYWEFLLSLAELQGRGQMALPDLTLPAIDVTIEESGLVRLRLAAEHSAWAAVFTGLVRAMADDYGSLALIELIGAPNARDGAHDRTHHGGDVPPFEANDAALEQANGAGLCIAWPGADGAQVEPCRPAPPSPEDVPPAMVPEGRGSVSDTGAASAGREGSGRGGSGGDGSGRNGAAASPCALVSSDILVTLLDSAFAEGRSFELAVPMERA